MQKSRLFEIIYILLEKKICTAGELAKHFEVSVRTIYRDVDALSQAGVPIYMNKGKGGGISLMPNFVLNKAVLNEDEKSDILSAMKAITELNPSQNNSALNKLSSMLGSTNSNWIEVDFSSWGYFENDALYFEMLKNAILNKHSVTFTYSSGKSEKLSRTVYPLKLAFKGAAWYLYGYCTKRLDYRFFKLRRITELICNDESFDMNAPERLFEKSVEVYGKLIKTVFLISDKMAFRVYDEISDYKIDENGNFLAADFSSAAFSV